MLYVTTRDKRETYTAQRALLEKRGPDGGFYVPLHLPRFSEAEIQALKQKSFGQCVAEILNLFFGTRLSAWDVECAAGRSPVRICPVTSRIYVAEAWHNLQWDFSRTASDLAALITDGKERVPADWAMIAIRIAVLFGFFGKLMRKDLVDIHNPMDVAVFSGDFSRPMALWYAREMGLPIGSIILCCNDNNNPWELLHHGAIRTGAVAVKTMTEEGDYVVPADLERFVSVCGGPGETARFLEDCRLGRMYVPTDAALTNMRRGMHASVVGQSRVISTISNVYRSHGCVLEPYTALVYSGLMDYFSRTEERRKGLILSDRGPAASAGITASAMGISREELLQLLKING